MKVPRAVTTCLVAGTWEPRSHQSHLPWARATTDTVLRTHPLGQGPHFLQTLLIFSKKAKGSQQLGKHFLTLQASTPAVTPSHLPGGFLSDHVAACPQSPAKSVGTLSSSPGGHDGALHAPGNPSSMKANLKGARVSCVQRHGARKKHDRFGYIFTELLSTGD